MRKSRARMAVRRVAAVVARASRAAGACIAAALLVLMAASPARAQFVCTTTPTDITCTNSGTAGNFTNTANGAGQNATTTSTGTAAGFTSQTNGGGNAVATNAGSNSNGGGNGLFVLTNNGGNATAVNTGTNFGAANGLSAAVVGGGNATVINTGINTGGINSLVADVFSGGGNATAINTGINTANTFGGGIAAFSNGAGFTATVVNSGSNTGTMEAHSPGGTAIAINSGSTNGLVLADAPGGHAIVINSGIIRGMVNAGGNSFTISTVTNSGTISNFGGVAIQFNGTDTLNLLPGSNITGAINLHGVNDTVSFFTGNQSLTFNTLAAATVTSTVPFVVVGNRAVTIDPTPFGLADRTLMDFTRGVSGMLDSLGGSVGPSGPISSAFAPSEPGSFAARVEDTFAAIPGLAYANDQGMVFKAPTTVTADGRAIWARGFGGERTQEPDGLLLGAHTSFVGGAVGFDLLARPDLRLGLFGGGGQGRLALDGNAGFTNTDTAFGGIYGRWGFVSLGRASFLDFALHGGASTNATSRTVSSNLVAGGIELATASYSSSYVSPELKYGFDVPLWAQYTLTPSLRVRYVAGFFGGYTESGTTAPLTVASRTISDFEERAELKLTRATPVGPDLLLTSVHVGAIGIERAGDTTVDTVLLGASLPFVTPGRSTVEGLVGGGGFEWRTREGVSLFGAAEAIGFSDQSTVWSARGGVRVAF